jgi:NitT/TauT family transport system permease protein
VKAACRTSGTIPEPTVESGREKVVHSDGCRRSSSTLHGMTFRPEAYVSGRFLLSWEINMAECTGQAGPLSGRRAEPASTSGPERLNWLRAHTEFIFVPLALVLLVGAWELIVWLGGYPAFILPSPGRVWARALGASADGLLFWHAGVTLTEILGGLALGLPLALVLGYAMAKSRPLERLLSPYVVASQSVPIVALAPLLVIWFGTGRLSKVLVCALTIFFPMLVNTMVGVRSVDRDLRDLMRSLRATHWQCLTRLEVPSALPVLLGGLKVSVTLSVIGAVVGEFVAADRGLGFLINVARGNFDTPLMFVALLTLVVIALALYLVVVLTEALLLRWNR